MLLKEAKNAEADEERSAKPMTNNNEEDANRFFFAMIRRLRIVDMMPINIVEPDHKNKIQGITIDN